MSQAGVISPGNTVPGKLIQQVSYMSAAPISIDDNVVPAIPYDNTIPQSNEGLQIASLAITPSNPNNILYLRIEAQTTGGSADSTIALFKDAGVDALAARNCNTSLDGTSMILTHRMVAGAAAAMTFTWRAGLETSMTGDVLIINGDAFGNPLYGGVSNIIAYIYEFEP